MISSRATSWFARTLDVFRVDGKTHWPTVFVFLAINLIVLANAVLHDSRFGYDAPAHLAYARTLAEGRLPTPADSHEFFCPPLPYLPAAFFWWALDGPSSDGRAMLAFKLAQLVQVAGSLVVCWSVLALAQLTRSGKWMGAAALVALGMVPTYYRTFAMIRGEPLMLALLLLGAVVTIRCFAMDRPTLGRALLAGALLGGAVMSRQWAFLALPALGLLGLWRVWSDAPARRQTMIAGLATLAAFFIVGSSHYIRLHHQYGSITAFNRPPAEDDVATTRQSSSSLLRSMVSAPVRHAFDGHPVWLFYADTWGDYSRYFLISARDSKGRLVKSTLIDRTISDGRSKGDNVASMTPYLGRVCAVSIVPTLVLLGGAVWGVITMARGLRAPALQSRIPQPNGLVVATLLLMMFGTVIGYCWFVATYPNVRLDTVKASYPLPIFPLLGLLAAGMWCGILQRSRRVAWILAAAVLVALAHNLPAMVTRYTSF